ncbi:MAG: hypothetical protein R6V27_02010 [Balneolaceae bacterium]
MSKLFKLVCLLIYFLDSLSKLPLLLGGDSLLSDCRRQSSGEAEVGPQWQETVPWPGTHP